MTERVTNHAAVRALERLKLGRHSFIDWCRATRASWIPVNAEFLHARGVRANSYDGTWHVTPWTVDEGVALLVSDESTIVTVYTFPQTAKLVIEASAYPPAPAGRA